MRTNRGWSGPTVSYLGNIFPQPKGHGLLALYTGIVCAPASNPTLQDHHNLCRGSPSCCKIFCAAAFVLEPQGMRIPRLHKQLVALILVSSCLAYFPFQSHPWLWHSTASSLVILSMALLKEIVDAWNSLRRIGHFGFDVDLVSCLRETRHSEWPQLKLMGFKHGIETVWDGKEIDQNGYPKTK